MKRLIIFLTLIASFVCSDAIATPATSPDPQYGSSNSGNRIQAYYYNYNTHKIENMLITINHRKVVEFWYNNTWVGCSIKIQHNKKGDEYEQASEEWRQMSRTFEYYAEVNGAIIYFNLEKTGYYNR